MGTSRGETATRTWQVGGQFRLQVSNESSNEGPGRCKSAAAGSH